MTPPKARKTSGKPSPSKKPLPPKMVKGWQQIAHFLGQPISVVQRWAKQGMPIAHEGRFVTAVPEQLDAWLGRESGEPVHVATEGADLSAELKRGLTFIRQQKS